MLCLIVICCTVVCNWLLLWFLIVSFDDCFVVWFLWFGWVWFLPLLLSFGVRVCLCMTVEILVSLVFGDCYCSVVCGLGLVGLFALLRVCCYIGLVIYFGWCCFGFCVC